ncbi:hypothetical protein VTN77DRAFT_4331 [Rasamsonia byssochlamydoides]|uniref:uncharacterized protein n=1 Tax=Rasamsonia byssochlamydoides TaxID=89139 RepID=UPI0037422AF1
MPVSSRPIAFIARRGAASAIASSTAARPCLISSKRLVSNGRLLSTVQSGAAHAARSRRAINGAVVFAVTQYYPPRYQSQSRSQFQQVRWESSDEKKCESKSKSESQGLRSVGFEDINASLADSTTATHKPVILIDVREPAELSSTGIIPGAVSIPLASQPDAYFLSPEEFETRFGFPKPGVTPTEPPSGEGQERKQESHIIFYCKAGVRARAAAQLAVQAGYDPNRIGVYDGSWLDWVEKGGKVERWEGEE